MQQKLISFNLYAEMGFLKKPEMNEGIYFTYNMLHKPALLGILGAILGLKGYEKNSTKKEVFLPEYYQKLKHLKIGIKPLNSHQGNFSKTTIVYNNSIGFASKETGGNLIIKEQTLIEPNYQIFLLLDVEDTLEKQLYTYIKEQKAVFLPYLGKNDFSVWWNKEEVQEYPAFKLFDYSHEYQIDSIFIKEERVNDFLAKTLTRRNRSQAVPNYFYFEKLPTMFHEQLVQYELDDFVYSNTSLNAELHFSNNPLFQLTPQSKQLIQLF
ncbi:MAG: type I-B CRISPR-associated protein Cas5 [Candidatus Gracilibacteria bacterium]|nr:type I-B CRISPR-associated protein Cas5 [Candidatus Gracilibacteria bacterium]